MVPLNPEWCTRCRNPKAYGLDGPCSYHRGPNGEVRPYTGHEVYHPTKWVMGLVGHTFKSQDDKLFRCIGYDPRTGLILRQVIYPYEERYISSMAIGKTFQEATLVPRES